MKKPSFDSLFITVALLLIFILLTRTPLDADQWWHLRSGEEMVTQGRVLLKDIFSYTRYGADWVNAFWLSDIFLYLIFKIGHYFSLAAFVSLMGVATFYLAQKQISAPAFLKALLIILAALAAAPIWTPRPQLFSFFLLALLDYWLFSLKNRPDGSFPFWILIPFFALWANLHGGYIWGILLLIAFLVGETLENLFGDAKKALQFPVLKKLFLFTILAFFAVLLNPNGFELWRLPFHTLDVSLSIQEWHSPDFHQISFHPMLWMLFLLIFALGVSRRKISYSNLLKVLGFSYLTFISQRNVAPFAIILLPILGNQLSFLWEEDLAPRVFQLVRQKESDSAPRQLPLRITRLLNGILISFILLAALGNLSLLTRPAMVDKNYPVAAVQWIKENQPEGALFNSYNWGGYLIWNLCEYPVFIDGRADLYGENLLNQWKQVTNGGETARQILNNWDVNLILLEPNWEIINELSKNGWKLLYEDETSVIYGR